MAFSVRSCATSRATAGTFRQGHGAAAERPVAMAASKLAGCCGRRRAARANGLDAGGSGRYFCCVCVVAGACGRVWALTRLRQVGWAPRASGDGLGWCWWAPGPSMWCVPCAPPRPAVRPFLTRFACLRCCCVGCRCATATLPYIKLQISSAGRSVGIIYTVIDCNIYVRIDCNAIHIILLHYIATSHSITATTHAK